MGIGALFEQIRDAVVVADPETQRILVWNQAATKIFGYSAAEALELRIEELVPKPLKAQHRAGMARYLKRGHGPYIDSHRLLELPALRKDGEEICIEMSLSPIEPVSDADDEGTRFVLAIIREITERKQAEEKLIESEERFRLLVEGVKDYAIYMLDPEGRVVSWNEGAHRIKGYSQEEILGRHFSIFYTEEDKKRDHPEEELRIAAAEGSHEEEGLRVRKDGSRFWASVLVTALKGEGGDLRGFSKVTRDITERKQAEEEIRQQAELLEQTHDAVFMRGLDGRIISWNKGAERLYGWSKEEAVGRISHELLKTLHPFSLEELEGKLGSEGHWEGELIHHARDGRRVVVESRHVLSRHRGEREFVLETNQDITERKQAEEDILQLDETLEGLKSLTAKLVVAQEEEQRKVAYEVHEGLAQLANAAYLQLQAFSRHFSGTEASKSNLEQAMKLIRQTISDARRITTDLRPTALDDFGLVAAISLEVERLCEEGYKVGYEQTLGDERLPSTLEVTLFRIAKEALTNVRKHAQAQRVRVELRRRGGEVIIEVRDDGRGLDEVSASLDSGPEERISLSGARERVELLGGELKITSKAGVGTSVLARVPLPTPEESL